MVDPYSDLGIHGTLMLSFFNDELARMTFYPSEFVPYLNALRDKRMIDLLSRPELHLPPHTVVLSETNPLMGEAYVSWQDEIVVLAERRAIS
jgi:hypothetical protein